MRVVIDAELFKTPPPLVALSALANHGLTERHRILISDDNSLAFLKWRDQLSDSFRSEWDLVIDVSLLIEAREPATRELWVVPGASDWLADPLRLSLADANNYLSKPAKVVVENAINDRNFVLCGCTPEQLRAVLSYERDGSVVFQHAGGITSMYQSLAIAAASNTAEDRLQFAIFDSDALAPGMPSNQSEQVRRLCAAKRISHHQLKRRAIENYIPPDKLRGWVYSRPASRKQRMPVFISYCRLGEAQRSHYNMKNGFAGDQQRAHLAGTLFANVSQADIAVLQAGFGGAIAELFDPTSISEAELRRDGSWTELNDVATRILAHLR